MKILEGVGLKKVYRQGPEVLEVIREVDLTVAAGEFVVIVGPSGAGKSTLLNLLGGLDQPTLGTVRFQGRNLYALPDKERARIRNRAFGFVFQFYHLVPELTALENVFLPARMASQPRALERSQALLKKVGLSQRVLHFPSELSGGEQQRVAIARALANDPALVFCDEPTGNLDSATGSQIVELLVSLNRERQTAFVVVTHEPSVAKVAHRVLSLKDGQLWPLKSI